MGKIFGCLAAILGRGYRQNIPDSLLYDSRLLNYFLPDMSKAAKVAEAPPADNLPFEEAMKRLETIVEDMESGELPLESLLTRFEEGTRLARLCHTRLADAELKIQKLEKTGGGEMKLKSLSPDLADSVE